MRRTVGLGLLVGILLLVAASWTFAAVPQPTVMYTPPELLSGDPSWWQYDFSIVNPSFSGVNVLAMTLTPEEFSLNDVGPISSPTGWSGWATSTEVNWLSSDVPYDVTPGTILSGFGVQGEKNGVFSFVLDTQHQISGDYSTVSGTASVVPEPGTLTAALMLLSPGGVAMAWRMRKRRAVK